MNVTYNRINGLFVIDDIPMPTLTIHPGVAMSLSDLICLKQSIDTAIATYAMNRHNDRDIG